MYKAVIINMKNADLNLTLFKKKNIFKFLIISNLQTFTKSYKDFKHFLIIENQIIKKFTYVFFRKHTLNKLNKIIVVNKLHKKILLIILNLYIFV